MSPEEFRTRIGNLGRVLEAIQGRFTTPLDSEQLEEIGFLTTRLATVEELIAWYCEALLIRPEARRVLSNPRATPVLAEQLSKKLSLYRKLVDAAGVAGDTRIQAIEANIRAIRDVAEDRHAIVHGFLCKREGGTAFNVRGRVVAATLDSLRNLTKRCQDAAVDLQVLFAAFYGDLTARRPVNPEPEAKLLVALQATLNFHNSSYKLREDTLKLRAAQKKLEESKRQAEEAKTKLEEARTKVEERRKHLARVREERRYARKRARKKARVE